MVIKKSETRLRRQKIEKTKSRAQGSVIAHQKERLREARAHVIAAHGSMSASESPAERCSAGHDMNLRPKKRAAKDEEDSKEDVQGRKAAKGSCHCCGGMQGGQGTFPGCNAAMGACSSKLGHVAVQGEPVVAPPAPSPAAAQKVHSRALQGRVG